MTEAKRFFDANRHLEDGQYDQAQSLYLNLIEEIGESGYLHYNLGSAYYRDGEVGKAIFHFKKAQDLLPRDADVRSNLDYARKQSTDKVEVKENLALQFVDRNYMMNLKESTYFTFAAFVCLTLLAITYLFKKSEYLRWSIRIASVILLVGILGTGFRFSQSEEFGVISSEKANIYSGKGHHTVLLFTLHEGTEFTIEKHEETWIRIQLADGKRGWINSKDIVF